MTNEIALAHTPPSESCEATVSSRLPLMALAAEEVRRGARGWSRSNWMGLVLLAGLLELGLLIAWQRDGYWGFSDGVYAMSAREILDGLTPYRSFAAAQPPPVFLVGALLLAVRDSPAALHVGLGLVDLITAGLVGVCVWRLERRRWLVLLAVLAAPLLPISLNSHAQLIPETIAAPLVLAGAMLCSRSDRQTWGAVLLALAIWCKVAFALPALAIMIVAPDPRRAASTLVGACVALFAGSLAVFGAGFWRETIVAQFQVGAASLHYVAGLLAQAGWNELPLAIGALSLVVLARRGPDRVRDPALVRTLTAAAVGGLLLALTVVKRGSYINVLVVAEPPLLVMAVSGLAWRWQRSSAGRPIIVLISVLLAAQTVSLLVNPADPWVAVRPFARSGLAWSASPSEVAKAVATAHRCPSGLAYSGLPYIAFVADRRMPGNQPDLFMLANARDDRHFTQEARRDRPVCP